MEVADMNAVTLHEIPSEELDKVAKFVSDLPHGSPLAILLQQVIAAGRRGADISVLAADQDLTPNYAAQLLRVSRPYLVKMMDQGHLAFYYVGAHRRIRVPDLLDFIERQEKARATVAHALGTPEHAAREAKDRYAVLTDDVLAALEADLP